MDRTEPELALHSRLPTTVADGWYRKGFTDGYDGRLAIIPRGSLAQPYKKGYAEGRAAAERDVYCEVPEQGSLPIRECS